MKKLIVFLLAAVMLLGTAQAQSLDELIRDRVIVVEGQEETITESVYVSANGYKIWIDGFRFWPVSEGLGGNDMFVDPVAGYTKAEPTMSVILVPTEVTVDQAETFIGEATAMYDPEAVSAPETVTAESGLEYVVTQAVEEGTVYRFYAVKGPEHLLCVTATYPVEAAEGYGVRIDAMIQTIEFTAE